ncbi:Hypothetical protein A7982_03643 [Minicystis rosea]|nr:Hypothetical protein A7982_03643 [Minicystis rosea]
MMRQLLWLPAIFLWTLVPAGARAQTISPEVHAHAEDTFRRGRDAFNQGEYKSALRLFRTSQELEAGRGKLINIAFCEEKLGLVASSDKHLREVLPQLPTDDPRIALVQQHLAELAPRIPHLRIVLAAGAPPGTRVSYDDTPLPQTSLGTEMAVDPGTHVVSASALGKPEKRYEVILEEGKLVALTVDPVNAAPPPPPAVAPPSNEKRTAGFIVGGFGVAGLAAGAATGIVALVDHAAIARECPSRVNCSPEVVRKANTGKALSIASTATFAAGAAAVGVGLYLVLSSRSRPTTVGISILPDGGRLGIQGTY